MYAYTEIFPMINSHLLTCTSTTCTGNKGGLCCELSEPCPRTYNPPGDLEVSRSTIESSQNFGGGRSTDVDDASRNHFMEGAQNTQAGSKTKKTFLQIQFAHLHLLNSVC